MPRAHITHRRTRTYRHRHRHRHRHTHTHTHMQAHMQAHTLTHTYAKRPKDLQDNHVSVPQVDPLLQVTKCDMCPQKVTNFVYGLCERCVAIWTCRPAMETLTITMDHVKAAIVSMSHSRPRYQNMNEVFRRVIEEEQRRRKVKVDLFQKFREKFQDGLLLPELKEQSEIVRPVEDYSSFEVPLPDIELDEIKDLNLSPDLLD